MRKYTLAILIILVAAACILTACLPDNAPEAPEVPYVVDIRVDAGTVPSEVIQGRFDATALRIFVTYSNDEVKTVAVNENMLDVNARANLDKVGSHRIKIIYENCQTFFNITVKEKPKEYYTLTVKGGVPVKVKYPNAEDFVDVNEEPSESGVFTAKYENGTVVTVAWTTENGYKFEKWTDNGVFVDEMSLTNVVMNEAHNYVAQSAPIINTVSFTTNCSDVVIAPITTSVLNAGAIETPKREGYVFDGWTTVKVIGEEAEDANVEKITFPYIVTRTTVLYGTWRRLGLEFDKEYYDEKTKQVGCKVVDYVRNDKEVAIPETYDNKPVLAIDKNAFINATALEKLTIPSSVVTIDDGFVKNCARLKEIKVENNNHYMEKEGVLYTNWGDDLIAYPAGKLGDIYDVGNVKHISDYAFYNAVLGAVILPSDLKTVGIRAFDSVHIRYVDFSEVVPTEADFSLGDGIFNDSIEYIVISSAYESVYKKFDSMARNSDKFTTTNGDLPTIKTNREKTLLYIDIYNNNSADFAGSLTKEIIGADRSLKSVDLPINLDNIPLSSIGRMAFNGCIYLENINIPGESRLERIEEHAFDDAPYLANLKNASVIANKILYRYYGNAESFTVDRDITRIAENAFRGNDNLKYITLNSGLTYIGAYAFEGCEALIGSDNGFKLTPNIKAIGAYAFASSGIKSFSAAGCDALKLIGSGAFDGCKYLTDVELGKNVNDIADDAFINCNSLTEFVVENNAEYRTYGGVLYRGAEGDALSLVAYPSGKMTEEFNPSVPEEGTVLNVTTIENYAFYRSNIASVIIPASVTAIGNRAFSIPGLVGVCFEELNSRMAYANLFIDGDDDFIKYEPEYVTVKGSLENLDTFFNSNEIKTAKYRDIDSITTEYATENGMIIRIENGRASVIRADRTAESLPIPNAANGVIVEVIAPYAFIGSYLTELSLSAGISEIRDNAATFAENLIKLHTVSGATPTASAASFSDRFNNGMFVYVINEQKAHYENNWNLSKKYLIDQTIGKPVAEFVYIPDEEGDVELTPIETGVITEENAPKPTRTGYSFVGWQDDEGVIIDFTNGYEVPYNIVFTCIWEPKEYTIIFDVGDLAEMDSYTTTVRFEKEYNFETPRYKDNSSELVGWYYKDGKTEVDVEAPKGVWSYYVSESIIKLLPRWKEVEFKIIYEEREGMTVDAPYATVKYGQSYNLSVPVLDGYEFLGWTLKKGDESGLITDENGRNIHPWSINNVREVTVYALWEAVSGIEVKLWLDEGVAYNFREDGLPITVTYGEEFEFPYNTNTMEEIWAGRRDDFCGWIEKTEKIRYTDENGVGLFRWENSGTVNLYAQWPEEISSGEELENLTDMSRSLLLVNDVTVTKPIGGIDRPYTGIFNGGNHTINFVIAEGTELDDGYIGLFAYNKGTIKNVKLNVDITVKNFAEQTLYIGAVAAVNEGTIIAQNGSGSDAEISISVDINPMTTEAYIGGIIGKNVGGSLIGLGMNLRKLEVKVGGVDLDSAQAEKYLCGTLAGASAGGSMQSAQKSFKYFYENDDDMFKDVKCGSATDGAKIDIGVTANKIAI